MKELQKCIFLYCDNGATLFVVLQTCKINPEVKFTMKKKMTDTDS